MRVRLNDVFEVVRRQAVERAVGDGARGGCAPLRCEESELTEKVTVTERRVDRREARVADLHVPLLHKEHVVAHLAVTEGIVAPEQHLRLEQPDECADKVVIADIEHGHEADDVLIHEEEGVLLYIAREDAGNLLQVEAAVD